MSEKPVAGLTVDSPGLLDKLWDLFSSMKLGLLLLGLIAVAAALGTFFPQEELDPGKAEKVAQIWQALGFTHVYGTVWFRFLLGLLAVNLVVCSIQRFQGIYQRAFHLRPLWHFDGLSSLELPETDGQEKSVKLFVERTLPREGYRVHIEEKDGRWGFVAQKRVWGHWGSFITHFAFVLLTLGALIGTLYGFKGFFMAGAGSTLSLSQIEVTRGSIPEDFSIRVNNTEERFLPNGERDNWYTDLSILENGREVARQTLSVNHPFVYHGVTFYQANYADGAQFTVNVKGQTISVLLQSQGGNVFQVPGTDLILLNAAMTRERNNPTVRYQIYSLADLSGPVQEGQLIPGQSANVQGVFDLTLDRYAGFTGLQVKKDPGVGVVWVGSALLMLGLLLSFYWRPTVIYGLWQNSEAEGFLALAEAKAKGKPYSMNIEQIAKSLRGLQGGGVS